MTDLELPAQPTIQEGRELEPGDSRLSSRARHWHLARLFGLRSLSLSISHIFTQTRLAYTPLTDRVVVVSLVLGCLASYLRVQLVMSPFLRQVPVVTVVFSIG